jgi:hypothetical protein
MIILNNNDLYNAVLSTISRLEALGMEAVAKELRAALSISSMPGEILGEIRAVLQRITNEKTAGEISYEIESEITYVDSVLR